MSRRTVLLSICFVFVALASRAGGVLLGVFHAVDANFHQQYLDEREALEPILASDPAFAGVEITERSNGGVAIGGDATQGAHETCDSGLWGTTPSG